MNHLINSLSMCHKLIARICGRTINGLRMDIKDHIKNKTTVGDAFNNELVKQDARLCTRYMDIIQIPESAFL